jgi:predicted nucleotidyltransferase
LVIDERFIDEWVERLRTGVRGAVAVILKGSHLRGNHGPWSDLDFDVLVFDAEIEHEYPAWIVEDDDGRLVHVSVAIDTVEGWVESFDEVAPWSFGFPSREVSRLLWLGRPSQQAELNRPHRDHPGGEPELEDFIEELGKARNARRRGDEIAMRLAVQEIAWLCPTLLVPLNEPRTPGTRPEALKAALDLEVVPPGYRDDMLTCLGLSGRATTAGEALAAGERLVMGTIALVEANMDTFSPLLPPDFPHLIASGLLRRYLEQETPPS